MNKLAQINLFDGQGFSGFGPLGLEGKSAEEAPSIFANFVSSAVGLITLVGIIWFVFIFVMGAVGIITSGGDKNSMESAKKKLSSGVIGLIVMVFALSIINFIGSLLGLNNILNFYTLFNLLQIK